VRPSGYITSKMLRVLGAAAWAVLLSQTPLRAQGRPLVPAGIQDLTFGTLIPGIQVHVLRTDPVGSGQFSLRGQKDSQVQMQFILPATMAGPLSATLPLSFGATDGGFSATESITNQAAFDPRGPALGTLSGNGRATIFLGGTAIPAPTQAAGSYSATITLTVSYTGL